MLESFESGALLGHVYELADGTRVRLRLARGSDAPAIRRLLEQEGPPPESVDLLRLVHFDPRRCYVLCATGLIDSSEVLLGVGVIEFDGGAVTEPELLTLSTEHRKDLAALLTRALIGSAGAHGRRRAA